MILPEDRASLPRPHVDLIICHQNMKELGSAFWEAVPCVFTFDPSGAIF